LAGKSVGNLSIGVSLDAGDAQKGLTDLIQQVGQFSSSLTNIGSSLLAGLSFTGLVSQMKDLVKFSVEFGKRLEAAGATVADSFGSIATATGDLTALTMKTGVSIEQLAGSLGKLGEAGLNWEEAVNLIDNASHNDDLFGGKGKSAEAFGETLGKLRTQLVVTAADLNKFQSRKVDVYGTLAAQLGVSAEEARKLVDQGKVSGLDAAAALTGAKSTTRERQQSKGWFTSDADVEAAGYLDVAGPTASELGSIRKHLQASRLQGLASMFAEEMKTAEERLAELIQNIDREIAASIGVDGGEVIANVEMIKRYRQSLMEKLDDLENEKAFEQLDAVERQIAEQKKSQEEIDRAMRESRAKLAADIRSVSTGIEILLADLEGGMEALAAASAAGTAEEVEVEARKMGRLAKSILNSTPEFQTFSPLADNLVSGSAAEHRALVEAQFPPEQRSIQQRLQEGIDKMAKDGEEQLRIERESLEALKSIRMPSKAAMLK